jgi:hypothetical protein
MVPQGWHDASLTLRSSTSGMTYEPHCHLALSAQCMWPDTHSSMHRKSGNYYAKNIRHHHVRCSRPGQLVPGICASLPELWSVNIPNAAYLPCHHPHHLKSNKGIYIIFFAECIFKISGSFYLNHDPLTHSHAWESLNLSSSTVYQWTLSISITRLLVLPSQFSIWPTIVKKKMFARPRSWKINGTDNKAIRC